MITAESVEQAINTWPAAVITIATIVGGWVTLLIRQRGTDNKLGKVQDQIVNGHTTNLRDDITEALTRLDLLRHYVENQPNQEDFRVLRAEVSAVHTRVTALEQGGCHGGKAPGM